MNTDVENTLITVLTGTTVVITLVMVGINTLVVGRRREKNRKRVRVGEVRPKEDLAANTRKTDWSWQVAVLALFGTTVALAALADLSSTRANINGNFSAAGVFTDLAGAGSLLSGVATTLVFAVGYWDRRKRNKHEASADVLTQTILHIAHPLEPDDVHALADLARALNADENSTKKDQRYDMGPPDRSDRVESSE